MNALQTALNSAFAASLETWILTFLLNSVWQVPLVFLAASAAARLAHPAGPRLEHRVWVGALLLEAALPFCQVRPDELGQRAWSVALWFLHVPAANGETRVILGAGTAARIALPWHTAALLEAVEVLYFCALLYLAARLAWGLWTTERLRHNATPILLTGAAAVAVGQIEGLMGLPAGGVLLASSKAVFGPATLGFRRQTLLLPPAFLDKLTPAELDALLAHEFAHMRRWDFLKNLLYSIVSLPIAYHPITALTRARLAETRELVCDAMAAEAVGGPDSYARSLLELARMLSANPAPKILHAIGILDANIFERRLMHLKRRTNEATPARRFSVAAGCVLLALATCASALALRMDVKAPDQNPAPKSIHVKTDALKLVSKVAPIYPREAKAKGIKGTVELAATIGKDGSIENLKALSGPAELQPPSLDAVRQWRYQPYLLNGDPIEVQTTIKIIYSLAK
jgi:TonB family protein